MKAKKLKVGVSIRKAWQNDVINESKKEIVKKIPIQAK